MAILGTSATTSSSSSGVSSTYLNSLISNIIKAERQPIDTLSAQKDQLNIKKAIYSDLKNKLLTLESIVGDLKSDSEDAILDDKAATSSDNGILTATVTSSAANGKYTISITDLAEAHTVSSDSQTSSTEALNLSGTFTLNGATIEVETTDSLRDIMEAINNADYETGKEVEATIINNRLVIKAGSTGTSHQLTASDTTGTVLTSLGVLDGGSFKTTLQAAEDAAFTVNGISVTRESNTGIDDVMDGVTLNLLKETEGADTIDITVGPDYTNIRAKVSAFVSNLNSVVSYLTAKTRTSVNQTNQTYTRGALTGEMIFSSLKMSFFSALRTRVTGGSSDDPEYLSDIGITVETGLIVSFDTSEFDTALESNLDGIVQLFDGVMDQFLSVLEPFTTAASSSNMLDLHINSVETRIENIDRRIQIMEENLKKREETLIKQYGTIYAQNAQFTAQQYSILSLFTTSA